MTLSFSYYKITLQKGNEKTMRIRKKKWAVPELEACRFFVKNPTENKGKWADNFVNKNPIYLELGCGKGSFAVGFIKKHKDINLIAIDIKSDMLGLAKRNIESINQETDNILLVAYDIERILDIFDEKDQIERIYINFCNPWPKSKHKKRRLTHPKQLELYKKFLKPGGLIYFKTDDDYLFQETIPYLTENGFTILEKTYDLHKENRTDNIITEHEKMFSEQGIKIKFLIAKLENINESEENETNICYKTD